MIPRNIEKEFAYGMLGFNLKKKESSKHDMREALRGAANVGRSTFE